MNTHTYTHKHTHTYIHIYIMGLLDHTYSHMAFYNGHTNLHFCQQYIRVPLRSLSFVRMLPFPCALLTLGHSFTSLLYNNLFPYIPFSHRTVSPFEVRQHLNFHITCGQPISKECGSPILLFFSSGFSRRWVSCPVGALGPGDAIVRYKRWLGQSSQLFEL